MENSKKNTVLFISFVIIITTTVFTYRKFVLLPNFALNGKYTIGVVDKVEMSMKGSIYNIYFKYKVGDILYYSNSSHKVSGNPKKIYGKKFMVNYLDDNKEKSEIILSIPIPDSIKSAPAEGWKELPEWAKKEKK